MSDKKKLQLGMNPSTASNRLVKDVLWKLIQQTGQGSCCKCGEPMSRETFSLEHLTPWLDSEYPISLYFDLDNVSFSHISCNRDSARRPNKIEETREQWLERTRDKRNAYKRQTYSPQQRHEVYKRLGA